MPPRNCFVLSSAANCSREVTAPVKPISFGKGLVGFLAVKENEFCFPGQIRTLSENPGQFEQHAGARATVVRAHESGRVECLCVVVRADEKGRGAILSANVAMRFTNSIFPRGVSSVKACRVTFHPEEFELFREIRSRLFDRLGSGWPRTEIHHRLNMGERFFAREFFPDFLLRAALRLCLRLRPIASARRPNARAIRESQNRRRLVRTAAMANRDYRIGAMRTIHLIPACYVSLADKPSAVEDALQVIVPVIFDLDAPSFLAVVKRDPGAEMFLQSILQIINRGGGDRRRARLPSPPGPRRAELARDEPFGGADGRAAAQDCLRHQQLFLRFF